MKRLIKHIFLLAIVLTLCACSKNTDTITPSKNQNVIDVDLSVMSSVMVYSKVNDIVTNPKDYLNKKIKVAGTYNTTFSNQTEKNYYYVMVQDATACCSNGLEFVWEGRHAYPKIDSNIEVIGT